MIDPVEPPEPHEPQPPTMTEANNIETEAEASGWSLGRLAAGSLLLLPAALCCGLDLLWPTLRTVALSMQEMRLLDDGTFVGLENYLRLLEQERFLTAVGFTTSQTFLRLLVVTIVPLLLAWAVGQFGRPVRLSMRWALSIPLALFAPVLVAVAWVMLLRPQANFFDTFLLADPDTAPNVMLLLDALYFFGLACGLGLIFYLPIWQRPRTAVPPTWREAWKPTLAMWGTSVLAVLALTPNSFTLPMLMTGGGPMGSSATIAIVMYDYAFRMTRMGTATAAITPPLLGALLAGLIAGVLVLAFRLRLTTFGALPTAVGNDHSETRSRVWPGALLGACLLLVLVACACSVGPMLWLPTAELGDSQSMGDFFSPGRVWFNTLGPALFAALVQVSVAFVAALGIGAVQPVGKWSAWLLLPFAPWLFVTAVPLGIVSFLDAQSLGILNTWPALIPPILLSVPALFILTLFFNRHPASSDNFFMAVLLPSLPLAGGLVVLHWVVNAQDLLWHFSAAVQPDLATVGVVVMRLLMQFPGGASTAVLTLTLPLALGLFLLLVPLHLYLDGLVLYAEPKQANRTAE